MIFGFAAAPTHHKHEPLGFPGSRAWGGGCRLFSRPHLKPFQPNPPQARKLPDLHQRRQDVHLGWSGEFRKHRLHPPRDHRCCVPGVAWSQDPRNQRAGDPGQPPWACSRPQQPRTPGRTPCSELLPIYGPQSWHGKVSSIKILCLADTGLGIWTGEVVLSIDCTTVKLSYSGKGLVV